MITCFRAIIVFTLLYWAGFSSASVVVAETAELNTYQSRVKTGADLMKRGDYRAAMEAFKDALRYYDGDAAAYIGLGIAQTHLQDDSSAERSLKKAIELNPSAKQAYEVLGDIFYRSDNLEAAVAQWERALEIDPSDSALGARLNRIRREHKTEKNFSKDATGHFSVKYEGREKIEAGRIVLRILEDAYGDIGRELSFYPDREVNVILYSGEQFREVTDAPGWSGGIFDGKIRIPIGGIEQETPGLRRLLYHEYTHAVIRFLSHRVPAWLNEGLAQYFEGRDVGQHQKEALRNMVQKSGLPSLRTLEGSFLGLGGAQAGYAYLISLSAVRYIVDQFGMYRVKMLIEEFSAGADTEKAVSNALLLSYEDFERGWRRSIE